ncbi:MAG: M15 family metallopeptidase [Bacteroidia bacterium]|nr:M15 family metallopeptidase [Bacteroidia bacterium]
MQITDKTKDHYPLVHGSDSSYLPDQQPPDTTQPLELSELEQTMIDSGLVNVQLLDQNIRVSLRYASDSNFLKRNFYGELNRAYLEENTAKKLALAQLFLSQKYPDLHLLVWDAARPIRSQWLMWNSLDMPAKEKGRFVSNPRNHSLHNYACAVDVTLCHSDGSVLDMGTDFDQFDTLAQPVYESYCLSKQWLTNEQLQNRLLLRGIMKRAGFSTIGSEWWHFNSCTRFFAKTHYRLIP